MAMQWLVQAMVWTLKPTMLEGLVILAMRSEMMTNLMLIPLVNLTLILQPTIVTRQPMANSTALSVTAPAYVVKV